MQRGKRWLSEGAETLAQAFEQWQRQDPQAPGGSPAPQFDVVVVGSGYGGAVAAKRLSALAESASGCALSVAVLERGHEYTPGSFPDRLADLVGHLRVNGGGMMDAPANPEGLMDWRLGGDVGALVANGLGGGSLINAGVCEPADAEVLTRVAWPEPWRGAQDLWQSLYQRARENLGAQPWQALRVPKQWAMETLAQRLDSTCLPATLSIVPPTAAPRVGTAQQPPEAACIECGDCFTGCNVGAKRTLVHNYLADAWRQGARLYTGATVHSVLALPHPKAGGARWLVRWRLTDPARLPGGDQFFELRARHVVLSAGTFGSTEILMRSRDAGLAVSGRLGSGFSANGDVLSALHDMGQPVGISPAEDTVPAQRRAGPTITQLLRWQTTQDDGVRQTRVVSNVAQDLTVPGALGWVFREILTSMMVPQRWTHLNWRCEHNGDPDRYAVDEAAIGRSLLTVAYVDDGALGRLEPTVGWATAQRDGELLVRWPQVGDQPAFRAMNQKLASAATGGTSFLHNPLWQFMPKDNYLGLGQAQRRLLTVHPLGGCRMATDARDGVVDPCGAVFNTGLDPADCGKPVADCGEEVAEMAEQRRTERAGQHDRLVHPGLYVLDGAIVPTALGINPLLTITALAEGAIDQWQVDQGWTKVTTPKSLALPDLKLPPHRDAPRVVRPTAIRFQERMQGKLPDLRASDPALDYRLSMRVRFAEVPDLQAFLAAPDKTVDLLARFEIETEPRDTGARLGYGPAQRLPGSKPLWLRGQVRWMAIEPSWVGQRLWRVWRNLRKQRWKADKAEATHFGRSIYKGGFSKLIGATHFGAVRQLAYTFQPLEQDWVLNSAPDGDGYTLPKGTVLFGAKRLGYLLPDCSDPESANPWRQVAELALRARLPDGQETPVTVINFDPMAALSRYQLPIRVRSHQDGVAALRDVASLGLHFGRVMFGLHMFSFRRAEYPVEVRGPRRLQRLPPTCYADAGDKRGFNALQIDVHAVLVTPTSSGLAPLGPPAAAPHSHAADPAAPLRLRLTRLKRRSGSSGLPVLLLHGFGSGGIQFTHPVITQPLAPWLACQGHDVWVAELRTSIGLDSAQRQWTMDEVAREDIPALIAHVSELTGGGQVQVVAHCIGAAMFSMAVLGGHLDQRKATRAGKPAPLVAGAVLMQVGPEVELPRNSRARAYVASRMRQLVGATQAQSVASQDISDAESMLDRIVGTFLYPELQREHYRLKGDVQRNASRTNANRSAAIFGQLFEYENMPAELLAVMDDLLGNCNLTTYEQTAQYAFGHRLTDHAGEDALVTAERLRKYFCFPVMLLHGDKNKTFKRRTLWRNMALMQAVSVEVSATLVPRHGHLDCVVGEKAAQAVFVPVQDHLAMVNGRHAAGAVAMAAQPEGAYRDEVRLPRVGPWLGHVERSSDGSALHLQLGFRVDDPGRDLQGVASLLCSGPLPLRLPQVDVLLLDRHEGVVSTALPATLAQGMAPLQLLLAAVHADWPGSAAALAGEVLAKRAALRRTARRLGTPVEVSIGLQLDRPWLQRMLDGDPSDLGLVLGACRQRPLLLDRDQADAAMGHVLQQLSASPPDHHVPIDAVVLAGDQIYADARVETGDAGAAKLRFLDAHHEAWSSPYQREVMRRRPTYMVVDDHEFRNDYNDAVARSRPREFANAQQVWQRYQVEPGPAPAVRGASWRSFSLRGFAVFLCDTRSQRYDPPTVDRSAARIMQADQMAALQGWLHDLQQDQAYGQRPKVVVTGSPIAPWFKAAHEGPGAVPASALWSDGWQRFPHSVADLLGFIAKHHIDNVLFLSGDYHRHADATLTLQGPARTVQARSIVTSGLYCPYPFVNSCEQEWLANPTGLAAGACTWGYELKHNAGGNGYTRVSLFRDRPVEADFVEVLAGIAPADDEDGVVEHGSLATAPAA